MKIDQNVRLAAEAVEAIEKAAGLNLPAASKDVVRGRERRADRMARIYAALLVADVVRR